MPLTIGTRLGSYEVAAAIGAGGMGEVYRARDTRLNRDVALKVLPEAFATDADRLARFTREAQTLATLNHPNIAQIYGIEGQAIVMELVEGDDLSMVIARGPIALGDALAIARQIADALAAAHEHGIVHRDLKPANIKIKSTWAPTTARASASGRPTLVSSDIEDCKVKVLDFGLAKAIGPDGVLAAGSRPSLADSPTMTSPAMTQAGMILGTAGYMAPEQAKGHVADARSDIWAFGVVLFEMLAGAPAFPGETTMEVLGAVLKSEPNWNALPADLPAGIQSLLRRCLRKDRKRRLHHIGDARIELDEAEHAPPAPMAVAQTKPTPTRERWLWAAAVVSALGVGAALASFARPARSEAAETRLQIQTDGATVAQVFSFALSPDGQSVVFAATQADGRSALWLRPLASDTAKMLPGTEGGVNPFWSPDGQSIGFFVGATVKRIDVAGGSAQSLGEVSLAQKGTWGTDGTILVDSRGPLVRLAATGGGSTAATRLETGAHGHGFPAFLPDGRRFLFHVRGTPDVQGIYIGSTESFETKRLTDADSAAVFVPPDFLLFARAGALLAQRLDLNGLTLVGDPFRVADRVAVANTSVGLGALSASATGTFAYRAVADATEYQLTRIDRGGNLVDVLGKPDSAQPIQFRPSPDGRWVALSRTVDGNRDIYLMETERGVLRRFTTDKAFEGQPLWSPSSDRILFFSNRGTGTYDLYVKSLAGPGAEELLLASAENKNPVDWSRDGKFILYTPQTVDRSRDIWALPLSGDKKPFPLAQTAFEETVPRFSPDGRWISFQSNDTGQSEIYVQPFPGPGERQLVSIDGGVNAEWSRDGREIIYVGRDSRTVAVPVTPGADGKTLRPGIGQKLFPVPAGDSGIQSQFTPWPTDGRFLVNLPTREVPVSPITVVLNWKPGR